MSKNRVIGADNAIPWHLPKELQRFKQLTMGHHMIMGRKTWESIGRLLPGRTTVIVTRQPGYHVAGAIVAHSVEEAVVACGGDDEIFVIGGEEIFRLALPLANRIYLTTVNIEVAGDTYMPNFDAGKWRTLSSEFVTADERNPHDFQVVTYERAA